MRTFASDNAAPAHPDVLAAITAANEGHAVSYGADDWTKRATAAFERLLGAGIDVYFAFNGTGANVGALASVVRPFEAVIAPASSHLNTDECGALERFAGCKILPAESSDGKLSPALLERFLHSTKEEHHVQPRAISISQSTEYGGVYSLGELRELCDFSHRHGLLVHMDGARIANAVAALNCSLADATRGAGIDILTFGGTKNGLLYGEAIVYFDPALHAGTARFVRKQSMQLASKMRYIAAQFEALLRDDLWLRNAQHANHMAKRLEKRVADIPGVRITRPVPCNAVFAVIPAGCIRAVQQAFYFHVFDPARSEVRWMTSYETTDEDIAAFGNALERALGAAADRV